MTPELAERLATLDAENRLRDEPAPLAARWWELSGLARDGLTRWTPVAVGARVARRADDGRLVLEGGVRIGPDTGRDLEGCRADLFETECAIAHALGFTPTIVGRPPWA